MSAGLPTDLNSLKLKLSNHILHVVLSRPEVHNAFNAAMISEITKVFKSVAAGEGVRVIVLTAEGKSFCSGADLGYMKSMAQYTFEENKTDADALFEMFESIRTCPVPVIGKVFGYVMGGGLGLVAACDMVAAHKDTQFAFTEARLGLVPSVISGFVLDKISVASATELMLTAETFQASKAREVGLVHFTGESEEVDDYIQSKIDYLLGNGPEALQATKELLRFVPRHSWADVRTRTTHVIAERRVSAEGQSGLSAFFSKSKPSWKLK